jgi:hypothetical protein
MKKSIICLIISSFAFSAVAESTNETTEFNKSFIESNSSEFSGIWNAPIVVNGAYVYPQKSLFSMDEFAYIKHEVVLKARKNYGLWNGENDYRMPISNKLRIKSGKAPVSKHDNQFIRLCRFNKVDDSYFEMSATQANRLSEIYPENFNPATDCVLGGKTGDYWIERYKTFYDAYGNKRGVR